jgi:hypothetical protein
LHRLVKRLGKRHFAALIRRSFVVRDAGQQNGHDMRGRAMQPDEVADLLVDEAAVAGARRADHNKGGGGLEIRDENVFVIARGEVVDVANHFQSVTCRKTGRRAKPLQCGLHHGRERGVATRIADEGVVRKAAGACTFGALVAGRVWGDGFIRPKGTQTRLRLFSA